MAELPTMKIRAVVTNADDLLAVAEAAQYLAHLAEDSPWQYEARELSERLAKALESLDWKRGEG